ncbi:MAG: GNAT family N-acetyltransferase [Micrococcales bacterium]|nr:GNAT family N-acetyltransferase [Micrococcales bacterium]
MTGPQDDRTLQRADGASPPSMGDSSASGFEIAEYPIPATLAEADDFRAATEVLNAVSRELTGSRDLDTTAEELFPRWRDQDDEPKRMLLARVDGRVVARAVVEWRPDPEPGVPFDTNWHEVQVHPQFRGRGIGTALADRLLEASRAAGVRKVLAWATHPEAPGPRRAPATGVGSIPASDSDARFLERRGFRFEQVERISRLPLPIDVAAVRAARASALSRAADYRLRRWVDRAPEEWLPDVAELQTRMTTDAPSAGMEEPPDPYDTDRVRALEERRVEGGMTTLVVAAEHVPSGRLAGFTELQVQSDESAPVFQEATLVLREHRGHRLGMAMKAENLLHLHERGGRHPSVMTWNAEENRYMLDVNEALGFAPVGSEGAWRLDLRPATRG